MSWYLIIFLVLLIVGSAGFIFHYCYANDFNTETLDIVFKAVGGSLIAVFFLIKGIWIETPRTESSIIPVAFLHNLTTGQLLSFSRPHLSQSSEEMDKFKGINQIETVSIYEKFKELNINSQLAIQNTNNLNLTYKILLDELEFIFFQWLSRELEVQWGMSTEKVFTLSGSGGGGFFNVPEKWSTTFKIQPNLANSNIFLEKFETAIRLPKDTTITRTIHENLRQIELKSPNIYLKITIAPSGGGILDPGLPMASKVASRLGIIDQSWWEHYFIFRFEYKISPFSRFSNRSKAEQAWVIKLLNGFEKAFSWDLFRKELK